MEIVLQQLVNLLKKLGLVPSSGHGETVLVWKDGEIVATETLNRQLPKHIN